MLTQKVVLTSGCTENYLLFKMNFAKQSPHVIYVSRQTSLRLSVSEEAAEEDNAIEGLQPFSCFRSKTQRLYSYSFFMPDASNS